MDSLLSRYNVRILIYQAIAIIIVVAGVAYLFANTLANLEERSIRTGFDFFTREASFQIGQYLIPFQAGDSYARAYLVGVLNTLMVSSLGIVLASMIGVLLGFMRLSQNWLVGKFAAFYIETFRNIPLLLQLFFWYALITHLLPEMQQALQLLPHVYLSKSGLAFPMPTSYLENIYFLGAFFGSSLLFYVCFRWIKYFAANSNHALWLWALLIVAIWALFWVVWLIFGATLTWDVPQATRFNFEGGGRLTPEFIALLTGLSLYTAAFIAEIVRGGINAVSRGQTEAAHALGLRRHATLRLVILPQALRMIIPPTISQYLNLLKNSSLAVAIGYPDLVSITNTSLNHTGQAIECISIMMGIYLTMSLSISMVMNAYNRHVARWSSS